MRCKANSCAATNRIRHFARSLNARRSRLRARASSASVLFETRPPIINSAMTTTTNVANRTAAFASSHRRHVPLLDGARPLIQTSHAGPILPSRHKASPFPIPPSQFRLRHFVASNSYAARQKPLRNVTLRRVLPS